MQSQQLPTESQVLEDEVLPGTENASATSIWKSSSRRLPPYLKQSTPVPHEF